MADVNANANASDDDASELIARSSSFGPPGSGPRPAPPPAEIPAAPKPAAVASSAARGSLMVTAGIILSRLFGLIRQKLTAHYFGEGDVADAIAAAFRIGNITQNLLGEGTLSASFIPIYARLRAAGRDP